MSAGTPRPAPAGFRLVTRDAHALYAQVGFTPLAAPERHMEIARPGLYRADIAPHPLKS